MGEHKETSGSYPESAAFSKAMSDMAERSQRIVSEFLSRQSANGGRQGSNDPLHIGDAFFEMTSKLMADPAKLVEAQMGLWQNYLQLWQNTTRRLMGEEAEPLAVPDKADRRFKDDQWSENEVFDFIKQSYLLTSRWMQSLVSNVEGLDDKTARKVDFYTRQFIDALAPSNFVATNPEVLRTTIESGGENLVKGLQHLLEDLERGKGKLSIRMTDLDAFQIGVNIATTPG